MTCFVRSQFWHNHLSRSLCEPTVSSIFDTKWTGLVRIYELRSHEIIRWIFAHYPSYGSHIVSYRATSCFNNSFQAFMTFIVRHGASWLVVRSCIVDSSWIHITFLIAITSGLREIGSLRWARCCFIIFLHFSWTNFLPIARICSVCSVSSVNW